MGFLAKLIGIQALNDDIPSPRRKSVAKDVSESEQIAECEFLLAMMETGKL